MATEIKLPSMGEGVNEATINKWLVEKGAKVEKDQAIVEVSTDKVDTEIVAPDSGFLVSLTAEPDQTVEVDQVLAILGSTPDDTKVDNPTQPSSSTKTKTEESEGRRPKKGIRKPNQVDLPITTMNLAPRTSHAVQAGPVRATPLARKLAKQLGIALGDVSGIAKHGKIAKEDVLVFAANNSTSSPHQTTVTATEPTKADAEVFRQKTVTKGGKELLEGVEITREPMSKMRRKIADHMVRSVRTSPHVTTTIEVDLHKVMAFRAKNKESFLKENGFKLTMTPFFALAAISALKEFPLLNASVDGYDILRREDINLGIAVAIDTGLIVPVIKKANNMSLADIAGKLSDLALRARNNKLKPDEINGGSFSITNPGMFGCLSSTPIINQPQVGILSVGAIVKRPVVIENDEIVIRPICPVGITFDHRVVDGEQGAKFLYTFKSFLEGFAG